MCENKCSFPEPSLEKQLKGHRNAITSLYFSPNEQQIASSSLDNSVLLWDLRGTMRSYRFQGHDEAVMDVNFSPSGKYMVSASRDRTVRIWVPTVTGSTGVFRAHSQTVRSVQFSPDGTKILTASDDKIVKIWSSGKHKFISSFVGHTNWVRCARFSNDSSVIGSCSDDKTTKLWNPETGECVHTYKDQKGHGTYLAWHPSGCYVAVGTSQGNIKLYDIRTHALLQYYSIHNDAVTQLAFHPSGSYILTSSKDGKMKILDLLEGHPIFTLSGHSGSVNAVNFSASGDYFASAGDDKLVFIWKTNFTELGSETKENNAQNCSTVPKSASQSSKLTSTSRSRNQGTRIWYLCYHSHKYPVTTFMHLEDPMEISMEGSILPEPNANSTVIGGGNANTSKPRSHNSIRGTSTSRSLPKNIQTESSHNEHSDNSIIRGSHANTSKDKSHNSVRDASSPHSLNQNTHRECNTDECSSYSVGNISHIPRIPPNPATYSIPSIMEKTTKNNSEDLFGMVKLKENDVCYTSGTIEWVGRKRNFPINSGFKIIKDSDCNKIEPLMKKMKTFDKTCNSGLDKDCDCADVLPTVNAIVDHLNALHEAVDLVDLRVANLEETYCNGEN